MFKILIFWAGILLITPAGLLAQQQMLFVSPQRLEISAKQSTATLAVTNKTDTTKHYKLLVQDQVMTTSGTLRPAESDFAYSPKRWLRFMPRTLVLGPGERQVVRVMAQRPENLPDGDYHTHLVLEETSPPDILLEGATPSPSAMTQPSPTEPTLAGEAISPTLQAAKGARFSVGARYVMGLPVVVQQGVISSSLDLRAVTVRPGVAGPDSATPTLVLANLTRSGNAEATGRLEIKANDGRALITPRRVRVYREVDEVQIMLRVLPEAEVFKGLAQASLTLDSGEQLTMSVRFD